ncbi:glyoxalase [Marinobacter sp. NP-4(2019)]|nr:glyoxalase [Marinobacter sp. NP-4(2019)]
MLKFVKFAELPVMDQDRALRFYTEKIGLKVAQDAPYMGEWRWIELEIPGAETRIMFTKRQDEGNEDTPRLVLIADSVDAMYQELNKKGVHFTKPPTTAPWNPSETFAQFRDSEGNGIVIGSN